MLGGEVSELVFDGVDVFVVERFYVGCVNGFGGVDVGVAEELRDGFDACSSGEGEVR